MPTNNIAPREWGESVWRALRWIAAGFPDAPTDAERAAYRAYFQSLGAVLPCAQCQQHYAQHLHQQPIDLSDRGALQRWLYALYLASTKRTAADVSFEQWIAPPSKSLSWEYIVLIALLALLLIACIYKKIKKD